MIDVFGKIIYAKIKNKEIKKLVQNIFFQRIFNLDKEMSFVTTLSFVKK